MRGLSSPRRVIIVVLTIALIVSASLLVNSLAGPSHGTLQPAPVTIADRATQARVASGKYLLFDYPSTFAQRPAQASGQIIESFSLASTAAPIANIFVSVMPLPDGNIKDNTAFSMRLANSQFYTAGSVLAGGQSFPVFSDRRGGYQKLAFAQNGQRLATISLTCASSQDAVKLDNTLKTILASLRWK